MPDSGAEIHYYRRGSEDLCCETILGERFIKWAYQDARLPALRRLVFHSSWPSRLLGAWYNSAWSRRAIPKFVRELDIDCSEALEPIESFRSFNAFFARRLKPDSRPFDSDLQALVSPADARVMVYPRLEADGTVPVKEAPWRVAELVDRDAPEYAEGAVAVFRLCPADYHRFHYPCDGRVVERREIAGVYHSVNPIALLRGANALAINKRVVTAIDSDAWGRLCLVEVGAFGVGGIVATHQEGVCRKMDEKGYFEFGGSSLVLVLPAGRVSFSPDLVRHSAEGYETLVQAGQTIGAVAATDG